MYEFKLNHICSIDISIPEQAKVMLPLTMIEGYSEDCTFLGCLQGRGIIEI